MLPDQNAERTGRVFDIGYQSYAGNREGRSRAWQTMFWDGVKNGMGIGRGGWAKFLPWIVVAPTILTGLVFAAIAAFFEQLNVEVDGGGGATALDLPGHQDLISVTGFLLLIFAAFIGPELVCPDRRNRVIHLYFVRPIALIDYLGARWCALVALLIAAGLLPHLTLWIGLLMGVPDAVGHIQDNWGDIPRFVGNSVAFAVFAASLTFAVSAITDRRMIATLIAVSVLMISSFGEFIVNTFNPSETAGDLVELVDLIGLNTGHMPSMFFGTYSENHDLNMAVPIAWILLLTALSLFATWRFYKAQR